MGARIIFDVEFYMKGNGDIPVQNFLYSLKPKLRAKAFKDIELLHTMGNELKEPYVKPVKGKKNKGFIKKTMKTPENEIDRARKYMDYKRRTES